MAGACSCALVCEGMILIPKKRHIVISVRDFFMIVWKIVCIVLWWVRKKVSVLYLLLFSLSLSVREFRFVCLTPMLFQIKKEPQDFVVEEVISSLPGEGDFLWLFCQKKDLTTMEVMLALQEELGCHRQEIGISGLKDKKAVTSQWWSFSPQLVEQWWAEKILVCVRERMEIIAQQWCVVWLGIASHDANRFVVRVRWTSWARQYRDLIDEHLISLSQWYPHCFGQQRFGRGNRNYEQALARVQTSSSSESLLWKRFSLESLASFHFNEYVMQRRSEKEMLVDGDIVVNAYSYRDVMVGEYRDGEIWLCVVDADTNQKNEKRQEGERSLLYTWERLPRTNEWVATGLLVGHDPLLCVHGAGYDHEQWWLTTLPFDRSWLPARGRRRPLWVVPEWLSVEWDGDDMIVSVMLPVGAYVTVLLYFLLQWIDEQSIVGNRLRIYH